ncbi:MAG: glycosyltransferase family 1 protein [Bacteroidetes bacterium]|nr:MAG: glycosyltransferase family 1 protein [Bacteroidota bacterium]MBL1145391.1 glycosyltransferase family 1 protein [Bacteroidota bacterium]NOG58189.1 glycosyltransferase [Bacteroidota bacterium]
MIKHRLNIAFIHGRPKGHPTHAMYANSIGCIFFHEDKVLRWQDLNVSKIRRYLSWVLNAFFFPKRKHWDIYFTECVRIPQLIQKQLNLISKTQRLVALMSDESLYYTFIKRYPVLTQKLMLKFWMNCDAIICIGEFQYELAIKLLPINHHKKVYNIFNGVPHNRIANLSKIVPNFESNNILFIGNASVEWRINYKGLDLMIEAFSNCCITNQSLTFTVVGDIPKQLISNLLDKYDTLISNKIKFVGPSEDIDLYLRNASLYLHCARGEAWGISIIEAMCAGVPAIVSEQTGAKQVVRKLNKDFIVPLDSESISKAVLNYFSLNNEEKTNLSINAKRIVQDFTEEKAKNQFIKTFENVIKDLKI